MEKANRNLSVEVLLDELTNISNRRGVKRYISMLTKASELKSFSAALLMRDIDYFKRYNDNHGHLEGDVCIKKIANSLKSVFGNRCGILGRFCGEEFVCFIKDVEYREVLELAELLRFSIENLNMNYIWDNVSYPVTISIGGVYVCNLGFNSIHEMYSIADEELYKAKNTGRNKVVLRNKSLKEISE